jgi:hypothetical protein
MKHWSRAELDHWKEHILAGQRGQIPESSVFAWRILPHPRNEEPRLVETFSRSSYSGTSVRWTPNELLYAEKMRLPPPQEITQNHSRWNGLPLARTSHIYTVYSVDLFQALLSLHEANTNLSSLVREIAQMEHQGPIHVREISWLVLVISYSCAFRISLVLAVRRDVLLCIYPSKGNHLCWEL